MTNRGLAVNLYMIKQMVAKKDSIPEVKEMMKADYEVYKNYGEYKGLGFEDFVNLRRNHLAQILGTAIYE